MCWRRITSKLHKTAWMVRRFRVWPGNTSRPKAFEIILHHKMASDMTYGFSVTDKAVIEISVLLSQWQAGTHFWAKKAQKIFLYQVMSIDKTLSGSHFSKQALLCPMHELELFQSDSVLEWFASCEIITKHSVADAYGSGSRTTQRDDYRRVIASMLRVADFWHTVPSRCVMQTPLLLSTMISLPILRPFTRYRLREILLPYALNMAGIWVAPTVISSRSVL